MKFYEQKIVNKVLRRAEEQSLSARKLASVFNIPDATISSWIRRLATGRKNKRFPNFQESVQRKQYAGALKSFKLDKGTVRILCALLYWCEGSKYPASNCINFCNSDSQLVEVFLHLLRRGFDIKEEKLRAYLQLHSTQNIRQETAYWSKALGIPRGQFYKPTITKPTRTMKRPVYHGTCTIKYYNVTLLWGIMGLYGEFADWLRRRRGG